MTTPTGGLPGPAGGGLRPYQAAAVTELHHLTGDAHARATCVLPCGTGKTLVAVHATTAADRVVVTVPTVALLEQTVAAWQAADPTRAVHAVCSPTPARTRTGDRDTDIDDVTTVEVNAPTTTDPDTLTAWVAGHPRCVIVSTYASAHVPAAAAPPGGWDALVVDEAHRTAGAADKTWGMVLDSTVFPARTRYFFTATPRHYEPPPTPGNTDPVEVASMTNPALYGPVHQPLSLREAITGGWLSDYRVAVVAVTTTQARETMTGWAVTEHGEPVDLGVAAAQVALARYAATHPGLRTALVFTNRVASSTEWARTWGATLAALPPGHRPAGTTGCVHVDGTMNAATRRDALGTLTGVPAGDLRVVSNCRVLAEGVDVPHLDAVVFAEPRTSQPDIVQIVGRALRPHPEGRSRKALVVVPVLVDGDDYGADVEVPVSARGFLPVWQVLTALAHEDTVLYEGLARARARAETKRESPADALADVVDIDGAGFPTEVVDQVALRVLRSTTSSWATLVARLRDHVHAGGDPFPRAGLVTADGYPLGRRARAARDSYRAGRMHPRVAAMFTRDVPGWSWEHLPVPGARPTFDDMLSALTVHVNATGVRKVRPYEATTIGGRRVPVGAWVDRQRTRALDPDQEEALAGVLGPGWRD